jgi:integrase
MLTVKKVDKLIRNGVRGRHFDAQGLYLVVDGPKAAHWERRYQIPGAQPRLSRNGKKSLPSRYVGLGSARVFTLDEARERNRDLSKLLADSVDPLVERRAERASQAAQAAKAVSFGQAAERYFNTQSPGWKHPKHTAQFLGTVLGRTLRGRPASADYCKSLRPLPVQAVDVALVLSVLQPIADRPETASRVRGRIEKVLDFSTASGWRVGDNPAAARFVGKLIPSRSKVAPIEHFAAVPYAQAPSFVADLWTRQGTAAQALLFLIYTAARSNEVLRAEWLEVDLDAKRWTVPSSRMKGAEEHRVPLVDPMVELLRALPREGDSPFVFLGSQRGKPLSDAALVSVMRRMGRSEVPHGFRSSFADFAHERTAANNIVIEMSLAHAVGSAVERSYRRTDLLVQRRWLMEQWAAFLANPAAVGDATVTPIRATDGDAR